jgi:DnaJ-class molecular chaperone
MSDKEKQFLQMFVHNFRDCYECHGSGKAPRGRDACRHCGGTGIEIESQGVMIADLLPMAQELLKEKLG